MNEPFRQGSHHLITGVVKDNGVAFDLSGISTLEIKYKIQPPGGALGSIKSLTCTPDGNQVANPGKYTVQCDGDDFDVAGTAYMQTWVTAGAVVHKSTIEQREVQQSIS